MTKYIIRWNGGAGDDYAVIDAEDSNEAQEVAYREWREASEDSADYEAMDYTEELAEDYGL